MSLRYDQRCIAAAHLITDLRRKGHLIREIVAQLKKRSWPYASANRVNKVLREAGLIHGANLPEPFRMPLVLPQAQLARLPLNWAEQTVCEINEEAALAELSEQMDALWGREIPANSPRLKAVPA